MFKFSMVFIANLIMFFMVSTSFGVETAITIQTTSETKITPTASTGAADESNGFSVANLNCDVMLLVDNTTAATATVTVTAQDVSVTVPGFGPLSKSNATVALSGAVERHIIGPFPCETFNNSSGAIVGTITGTNAANVAISPFRFDRLTSGL